METIPSPLMAGVTTAGPSPDGEQMDLPLVLLLRPLLPGFDEVLSKRFRFLKPWESTEPLDRFLAAHAASVRAILCSGPMPVTADTMALLPSLEMVVGSSVGVDLIDLAECRRRGIAVTNAGGVFTDDSADYAVGLLIDVLRRISAAERFVWQGRWPVEGQYPLGYKLGGKRVGIVGLGNIGSKVAKRLEGFGCTIFYHSRKIKPCFTYKYFSDVQSLASEVDILVLSCALTSETHHIINKGVMTALGKEGIVINVGRGALIDEKELVRSLAEGEIGGAGLDVFENEPEVPEELFAMENVVLSPHQAVLTPDSFLGLLQMVEGNLDAFFSNRPLLSPFSE